MLEPSSASGLTLTPRQQTIVSGCPRDACTQGLAARSCVVSKQDREANARGDAASVYWCTISKQSLRRRRVSGQGGGASDEYMCNKSNTHEAVSSQGGGRGGCVQEHHEQTVRTPCQAREEDAVSV